MNICLYQNNKKITKIYAFIYVLWRHFNYKHHNKSNCNCQEVNTILQKLYSKRQNKIVFFLLFIELSKLFKQIGRALFKTIDLINVIV